MDGSGSGRVGRYIHKIVDRCMSAVHVCKWYRAVIILALQAERLLNQETHPVGPQTMQAATTISD